MMVLSFLLLIAIIFVGRYEICSYKLMPQKVGYWYFFIIIFILSAFRFDVGYDYMTYYNFILAGKDSWAIKNFELIPRLLMMFSIKMNSPWIFFFISSFVILFLFFLAISEESTDFYVSLIIFITLFYLSSLSTIRQWLAIAILFYGFKYVKSKKFFRYLICVLLAFYCHASAIISIAVYFLYNLKKSKFIISFSLLGFVFGKKILNLFLRMFSLGKYMHYLEDTALSNRGSGKIQYVFLLLIFFSLFVLWNTCNNDKKSLRFLAVVSFGIIFPNMLGSAIGSRVSTYFYIFLIYLIPLVCNHIKETITKFIIMVPFYLYHLLHLYIDSVNDKGYTNYSLYFFR